WTWATVTGTESDCESFCAGDVFATDLPQLVSRGVAASNAAIKPQRKGKFIVNCQSPKPVEFTWEGSLFEARSDQRLAAAGSRQHCNLAAPGLVWSELRSAGSAHSRRRAACPCQFGTAHWRAATLRPPARPPFPEIPRRPWLR